MRKINIAAIPADGIGPEVIAAGLRELEAIENRDEQLSFEMENLEWESNASCAMLLGLGPCAKMASKSSDCCNKIERTAARDSHAG